MDKLKKAPIVGLVRYSQRVALGKSKHPRNVFEPSYFDYRFKLFESICLKSFQNQSNQNFKLVLFHSDSMPQEYKKRFAELERQNHFLHNLYMEDQADAFNEAIESTIKFVSFSNGQVITFRIDNDDAVQSNYIETLSRYLKPEFDGHVISMPNLKVIQHLDENTYAVQERQYPVTSIGLAYVSSRSAYKTALVLGDHREVHEKFPYVMIDDHKSGGLMTINGENVANRIDALGDIDLMDAVELKNYLKEQKLEGLKMKILRMYPIEDHGPLSRIKKLINRMWPWATNV